MLNFTQYVSTAEDNPADIPSAEEMQADGFSLSATDTGAPAFGGSCIASSPSAPSPCTGDECKVYIEDWGMQWMEFAILVCMGSYVIVNLKTHCCTDPYSDRAI